MRLPVIQHRSKTWKDLRTLAVFIETYCCGKHGQADRFSVALKSHDLAAVAGHEIRLCRDCTKLLTHAFVKRSTCPLHPKPWCKHCPQHCYAPAYRAQIREVMKYSGMRLVFRGRVDYLLHFLF